jgi:NADPH:quinone reductase-like Zn-dependent oxidoreductase
MKAICQYRYGSPDVLELREAEAPVIGADGVLLRVAASSANALDWHMMRGLPYFVRLMSGLRKPKSHHAGVDVAGRVEAVGANVTGLRVGDQVFGRCDGAFAEFAIGKEKNLAPKPAGLTFDQAATIPVAGCTALQALRDAGKVRPGQRVLINGAAGGVGTFAVQIARAYGADVTGVCSTPNLEMVRSIGADQVIDYTVSDFTRGGRPYDLIIDIAGNRSISDMRRALTPTGLAVLVGGKGNRLLGPMSRMLRGRFLSKFGRRKMVMMIAVLNAKDLLVLKELVEAGKVKPVIDRTYPLAETAEAIRYLETGHARGKVVVTV